MSEETRASIIDSIGNTMNNLLESEEREVTLFEESMEHEPRHVDD